MIKSDCIFYHHESCLYGSPDESGMEVDICSCGTIKKWEKVKQEIKDFKQAVRELGDAVDNAVEQRCICWHSKVDPRCIVHKIFNNPTIQRIMQEGK